MDCDVCKSKKATVYLTQIVKGEMQKVNLCEGCAQEKGVSDPTGFALADLLLGFGQAKQAEAVVPGERQCPACSMTQTTFRKTGRLGCADCYAVFAEGMDNLLKAMHKGVRHSGRVPHVGHQEGIFTSRIPEPPAHVQPAAPAVDLLAEMTVPEKPAPVIQKDTPPFISGEDKLFQLHTALDAAVQGEHFEEAASLLEKIRRLTGGAADESVSL